MSTVTKTITGQVAAGATAAFTADIKKLDGTSYLPSEIASVEVTIADLGAFANTTAKPVTGFNPKQLTVSDVMFAPQSKTYNGKSYHRNFEWIPDIADEPFKLSGHYYRVIIKFTPVTTGICSPLVFQIKTI